MLLTEEIKHVLCCERVRYGRFYEIVLDKVEALKLNSPYFRLLTIFLAAIKPECQLLINRAKEQTTLMLLVAEVLKQDIIS